MYAGKKKCSVLRSIRCKIADANNISYKPHKCNHKGDCQGTCPACEQEVQYLESQLRKRSSLGKAAIVVGTAVGISALATSMSSCKPNGQIVGKTLPVELEGDVPNVDTTEMKPVKTKQVTMEEAEEILKEMPVQQTKSH